MAVKKRISYKDSLKTHDPATIKKYNRRQDECRKISRKEERSR